MNNIKNEKLYIEMLKYNKKTKSKSFISECRNMAINNALINFTCKFL